MDAIKNMLRSFLPDTIDLEHPETILPALVPGLEIEQVKAQFLDIALLVAEQRAFNQTVLSQLARIEMKQIEIEKLWTMKPPAN